MRECLTTNESMQNLTPHCCRVCAVVRARHKDTSRAVVRAMTMACAVIFNCTAEERARRALCSLGICGPLVALLKQHSNDQLVEVVIGVHAAMLLVRCAPYSGTQAPWATLLCITRVSVLLLLHWARCIPSSVGASTGAPLLPLNSLWRQFGA